MFRKHRTLQQLTLPLGCEQRDLLDAASAGRL
jgi:hypothetical protein